MVEDPGGLNPDQDPNFRKKMERGPDPAVQKNLIRIRTLKNTRIRNKAEVNIIDKLFSSDHATATTTRVNFA